jgi:hypothetical protein
MTSYNRVLLHEPPFFRQIEGRKAWIRDASSFPFIIEEIISVGAIGVAIPAESLSSFALDTLFPPLKRRIKIVDKDLGIAQMDRTIRQPINQEFGLKRLDTLAITFEKEISRDVQDAVCCLEARWYHFLLGLEYGLQIDVEIERLKQAVVLLRNHAKTPNARATLATFAGILASYEPHEVGVIEMVPVAQDELVQVFETFLEDETYRAMSEEFHDLGFAHRLKTRLSRIGTLSKRLVHKKVFKNIVDLGTKSVTAATKIPLPEAELGERLLKKKYLPPAISLKRALKRAHDAWEKSGCEFVSLKGFGQPTDAPDCQ